MFKRKRNFVYSFFFSLFFLACFFAIHIKTKITILGYKIGRQKTEEAAILIENSLLTVELSKITTKKWLLNFVKDPSSKKSKS